MGEMLMSQPLFALPVLVMTLAAATAHAQQTERWTELRGGPVYTERWSESPLGAIRSDPPSETQQRKPPRNPGLDTPAPAAAAADSVNFRALPVVEGRKVSGVVEVRSDCSKLFASRSGPQVHIRWYGITKMVTLIGRRTGGELCAVYDDGSSEWISADRVMSSAEKQAHDEEMVKFGEGLQRPVGGSGGTVQGMMDGQRDTANRLHQESLKQYEQTEKHYDDRRRYGYGQ